MGKKNVDTAAENIKVLVRCRPLSEKEKEGGHKNCVEIDLTEHTVSVKSVCGEPDRWTFDAVINNTFSQKDIFTQFIMPLVDSVLDGFNSTVFAYGQSGSGKTHTMTGVLDNDTLEGVIPRSVKHIFSSIKNLQANVNSKSFSMYVSFVEIYNGKVRDLLSRQQITLDVRESKDHTFFVQGVNVPQVKFPEDVTRLMDEGTERRRTASTDLNADSSRSHSIFTLILSCTETLEDGTTTSVTSKLNLVDLAGSERQGKTGASGDTLKEGCNINLSLSALGTVIDTIVKGGSHIPFRSSPLTMLLKDSLGGNSKTVMFANINPSERNLSETVSTLRFADRAKQIKNKPVVNMDTKDQKIAELSQIVSEMRERLKKYETQGTRGLEEEVEKLRERVGELNVELENVQKGREADDIDFRNAQIKLETEQKDYAARIAQLEEQIDQLRNELTIAETNVKSERSQREEILHLCAKYLLRNSSKDESSGVSAITNARELTEVLRKHAHRGSTSGELAKLNTQIQTLKAANASLKKEIEGLQGELEVRIQDSKAASRQNPLRPEKKTVGVLDNTGTLASAPSESTATHPTALSEDNRKSLIAAVEEAKQQIEDGAQMKKIDEQLQKLNSLAENAAKEPSAAKQAKPNTASESDLIQQLFALVSETDCRSELKLKLICGFYKLLSTLRTGWRRAYAVPMTLLLHGDRNAAQKAIHEMESTDAKCAEHYSHVVSRLTEEVTKAYAQRNNLIGCVATTYPNPSLDPQVIQDLLAENNALHQQKASLEGEYAKFLSVASQRGLSNGSVSAGNPSKSKPNRPPSASPAATLLMPLLRNEGTDTMAAGEGEREGKREKEKGKGKEGDGGMPSLEKKALRPMSSRARKSSHSCSSTANPTSHLNGSEGITCMGEGAVVDLGALRAELDTQRAGREAMEKARDALYRELTKQRRETSTAVEQAAQLQGQLRELEEDCQRRLAEAQSSVAEVGQLQARLEERNAEVEQLRSVLDVQKGIIVKVNKKVESLTESLKNAQAEAAKADEKHRQLSEEKDANIQHLINERVTAYMEDRMKEDKVRNKSLKRVKKKMQKLQEWITELEGLYDKKMCECEDLRQALGEQKFEQLKLVRQLNDDNGVEIDDHRSQIQSTLERVKEERRRRVDLFDLGEFPSAKKAASHGGFGSSGSD